MRSRLAWLIGLAGLLAFLRRRRLRRAAGALAEADPALELRRRLDAVEEPPTAAQPAPDPERGDLDERRRQVHDAGRAAVDQMGGAPPEE